ncbi:MAG: hypothetical protein FJY20_00845 [Bacteroidetes bacterium]|nr:hypothetical protein [Bacteroidota bacterium]
MFRTATTFALALTACMACNNEAKNNPAAIKEDASVTAQADTIPVNQAGSDRDEKGCTTSAGYRWSVMKDTCIRIFEAGIKMLPKDPSLDKTTALILFSARTG